MFGSDVLDVAIGVTLLFLLVSLICTAVREGIEAVLKTRAKDLEQGIREMLNDPEGTGMTRHLFGHPLVYSLFAREYKPGLIKKPKSADVSGRFSFLNGRNLPSYIPSRNFAVALMDLVTRGPILDKVIPIAKSSSQPVNNVNSPPASPSDGNVLPNSSWR